VEEGEFGSLSVLPERGPWQEHVSPSPREDRVPRPRRQGGPSTQGAASRSLLAGGCVRPAPRGRGEGNHAASSQGSERSGV